MPSTAENNPLPGFAAPPLYTISPFQSNHGFDDSNIDPILLNESQTLIPLLHTTVERSVATHSPAFAHKVVDTQDLCSYSERAVGCDQSDKPTAPEVIDLTSFEGFSYPEESPTIVWPGGRFKTKLPYIKRGKKNILEDEAKHVEALARQATLDSPLVERLTYQDFSEDQGVAAAIAEKHKDGQTVVLRGHPYKPVPVDAAALMAHFRFQQDITVVVNDAAARLKSKRDPHVSMSLAKFCQGTKDNSRIQCILDMPAIEQNRPSFMKFLDDGLLSHQTLHNYSGRSIIPLNVIKASSWVLLHQGLYHTFAYHNVNSYCTWTQVLSSAKFWTILCFTKYKKAKNKSNIYNTAILYSNNQLDKYGYYGKRTEMAIIYGEPGDIIIMPPDTFYKVYILCLSVIIGGHFYSYNSLLLTEIIPLDGQVIKRRCYEC